MAATQLPSRAASLLRQPGATRGRMHSTHPMSLPWLGSAGLIGVAETAATREKAVGNAAPQRRIYGFLLGLTIGMAAESCKLIRRSIRRSIWYHKAVCLDEITFSNIGTYFIRNARSCWSMAVDLFM
jgi:hypothetical protein